MTRRKVGCKTARAIEKAHPLLSEELMVAVELAKPLQNKGFYQWLNGAP